VLPPRWVPQFWGSAFHHDCRSGKPRQITLVVGKAVAADHGDAQRDGFEIIGHWRIEVFMSFSAASSASDSDS
jgi:hypothetical protein